VAAAVESAIDFVEMKVLDARTCGAHRVENRILLDMHVLYIGLDAQLFEASSSQ